MEFLVIKHGKINRQNETLPEKLIFRKNFVSEM
jgi:hypothetical protein